MVNGTLDTSLSSQLHIFQVQRENRDKHAARYTRSEVSLPKMRSACEVGRPEFRAGDLRPRLTRDLIRELVRSFPHVPTCPALPARNASTWEGGTANPEATYDIHILGGVCPLGGWGGVGWGEGGEGRQLTKDEDTGRCREREGECGRGWLVVVGRASKAVVQTSGTMEATLVF